MGGASSAQGFFFKVFVSGPEGPREYGVESLVPYKNNFILKLEGVETIDQAERLAGREILLPPEAAPPAGEGQFFSDDLRGAAVLTTEGREVGRVVDVWEVGEAALLVVDPGPDREEVLIPFNRTICVDINPKAGRIVVDPPEGLLDLNEI
ncbi:MAG: 16S rRNA processing protein RimM [Candidatus Aminicenantes bacterium]|nr:16S rRNA processing protein RimM [Candidatus Aminicenantes bacterium]